MMKSFSLVLVLTFSGLLSAQPISQTELPEQLQPWVDWVLHGEESLGCPYNYDDGERSCAWLSRLQLQLNDHGGQFSQLGEVFRDALIRLPGEADIWPRWLALFGCLIALSARGKLTMPLSYKRFNVLQVMLVGLCLLSLSIMLTAVANGLLGSPDMQIAGNGSSSHLLNWYQDRTSSLLPQPAIISVPIWIYRVLMLAWAMWLAMSLLNGVENNPYGGFFPAVFGVL